MMYEVKVFKGVLKSVDKMPNRIQKKFLNLLEDLATEGPFQCDWPKYGKLSENIFHCHLAHKWVACWRWEKDTKIIEVYYAGSRENAPY